MICRRANYTRSNQMANRQFDRETCVPIALEFIDILLESRLFESPKPTKA